MARIEYLDVDTAPSELAKEFQSTVEKFGVIPNFVRVLGHAPEAIAAWNALEIATRVKNIESNPELLRAQMMTVLRTSWVNSRSGAYCLAHNVKLSAEVGLSAEEIEAVQGDYQTSETLSEKDKAVIRWAEAVTRLEAIDDDAAFKELRRFFTDSEMVEITIVACMWNFSNRLTGAFHIEPEPYEDMVTFFPEKGGHPGGMS